MSDGSSIPISQAGGPDGGNLFQRALPEIARRQELGASLLFFLHSLTTPRLLRTVQRHYDLDLLCWKLRWLGQGEYGMLRENFRVRARKGLSFLYKATQREAMVAGVWLGRRKESV